MEDFVIMNVSMTARIKINKNSGDASFLGKII